MRAVAWALLTLAALACGPARAEGFGDPRLFAEFDARLLDDGEKRLLQIGLAAQGVYAGLIDGRWGPASQAAFERYAVAAEMAAPGDKVLNLHMATLGVEAFAFVSEHDLSWRGGEPFGHRLLAPPGPFLPDPDRPREQVLEANGLTLRLLVSDAVEAGALHAGVEAMGPVDYQLRRDRRFVTATQGSQGRIYLRSDWSDLAGAALTTIVTEEPWAPAGLYEAVVGSLSLARGAESPASDGLLMAMVSAAVDLAGAEEGAPADPPSLAAAPPPLDPAPSDPAPVAPPPVTSPPGSPPPVAPAAAPGAPRGTGTAFFVNNTDLLTAAHVVDDCAGLARVDGAPLDLVAVHPDLDLALLSSRARSRSWIALGGPAALGQRVFALGYPFFGRYGTGLNMTAGNVSVMAGLADDPDGLTITAPVQPGNSGGPLLGRDGRLVGVVVARLDHLKVAEDTGALPENINFAVEGAAVRAFLEAQGVALPPPALVLADVEEGLPEPIQQAVIPVVCLGP